MRNTQKENGVISDMVLGCLLFSSLLFQLPINNGCQHPFFSSGSEVRIIFNILRVLKDSCKPLSWKALRWQYFCIPSVELNTPACLKDQHALD